MIWLWYLFIAWMVICIIIAYVEAKKAPTIDDKIPFLHDDYDENLDPVKKYKDVFCEHCVKNIDGFCNNGIHFSKINEDIIKMCKKEHFFEP